MMDNKGVSLLEVLVGLLLLSLIAAPFIGMFTQSARVRSSITQQLDITYLARNRMEIIMSKSYQDAMDYCGITREGDYLINTSISPYSVETGGEAIYIIAGSPSGYRDEIRVYTPDGFWIMPLADQEVHHLMNISLQENYYYIELDGNEIHGEFKGREDAYVGISLIHMPPDEELDFYISGSARVRIYSGLCENWDIYGDGDYMIIEKCDYRDYSIFKVRIEILKAAGEPIYWIENIISLKH